MVAPIKITASELSLLRSLGREVRRRVALERGLDQINEKLKGVEARLDRRRVIQS